jgi:ABC-type amino acid transport substrate-binding protein
MAERSAQESTSDIDSLATRAPPENARLGKEVRIMKWPATLVLALLTVWSFTAVAVAECPPSALDVVQKRGKLIVGVRYDAPPYGYVDKETKVVGFDVDIARYFAKKLGVELELVQVTAKTRIPLLLNGNVDLLAAGMGHYVERNKVIDFSMTYHRTVDRLLVKKGSTITGYRDLAGKTLGVVQGTVYEKRFLSRQPSGKIAVFQEYPQALLALEQGKIDALQTADFILVGLVKGRPNLEVVGSAKDPDMLVGWTGLGVRQNDSKWLNWVNFTLIEMWKNGTLQRLHRTHVGADYDPEFAMETWDDS